jgi:membrane protein implicated in regulation of membrane protease activity
MIDLLLQITSWHWLGLGGVLLIIELFSGAGLLLWAGIAALEVGILLLLYPFGWQEQWLLFAIQSIVTTGLWWRWQQQRDNSPRDGAAGLNQRMQGYLGREVELLDDTHQGLSRVRLDDTVWSVSCEQVLPAGSRVKITGAESSRLLVEAVIEE